MLSTSDTALFLRSLAALPLVNYQAGETVLTAASTTDRLLNPKNGAVAVVMEGAGGANLVYAGYPYDPFA